MGLLLPPKRLAEHPSEQDLDRDHASKMEPVMILRHDANPDGPNFGSLQMLRVAKRNRTRTKPEIGQRDAERFVSMSGRGSGQVRQYLGDEARHI
jgi:hypothetical protein